ncbi:hypothetical protein, partial [Candidatus Cardinium sp. TP]|uniref:hypothetical protein n=1 Tax=Candidatus Cardinium sp. TP TaxID=2961955 RepID=UPI0021AFAAB9
SRFRVWHPLGWKQEIKAGNLKPYSKSLQTELSKITRETYVRIVVRPNMGNKVETHKTKVTTNNRN